MTVFDFTANSLDGKLESLDQYRGKVLLIVNVASECGFTPQYKGLEALYRQHKATGFVVLGFPCDQFGHQEPGDAQEIQRFCREEYDITFPMFAKIDVNGDDTHPLFRYLKSQKPGIAGTEAIKWNFTKFLVARDGAVVARFAPKDTPERIGVEVEGMLG
mgnify:CR=1 FL=1